jgi:hypothetical protein
LKIESKSLVCGLVLAVAVYGGVAWNKQRLDKHLRSLVAQCDAINDRNVKVVPEAGKPWTRYRADPLVCEPNALASAVQVSELQADILGAHSDWKDAANPIPAAVLLTILSAVPWLWYFLLRRIVELRNAIGGKAP